VLFAEIGVVEITTPINHATAVAVTTVDQVRLRARRMVIKRLTSSKTPSATPRSAA
jgi:hypothetical protein